MEIPEIIPNYHPLFVHFTIALLSIATLLFLAGKVTNNETLTKAGHINLWLGALITIGTVAMGFYAYNTVVHDGPSHAAMTDHKSWALPTAGAFIVLALWSAATYRKTIQVGGLFLVLMVVASGSLAVAGFKGGEAVYRYGLGVMSMPQISGDGGHDSHEHAPGSGHDDMQQSTPEEINDGHGHGNHEETKKEDSGHNDGHDDHSH